MLTICGTWRCDWCQKIGLSKWLPREPIVFLNLFRRFKMPVENTKSHLPSRGILDLLRFPWGHFWRFWESARFWLAKNLVVDVWRHREIGPVAKDQPFQMPYEDTKSLPQSFFILETLKFEWGYSWYFRRLKNFDQSKIRSQTFSSRRAWNRRQRFALA